MRIYFHALYFYKRVKNSLLVFVFVITASVTAFGQAPSVEKVEPPNWWAAHSVSTVRVLVRGTGLKGASVRSRTSKTSNVRVNERGDHLFFDIEAGKQARTHKIDIRASSGTTSFDFEVKPKIDVAKVDTVDNDDIIYLIMTDRFADGDPSNNQGVDKNNLRAWHGGDFKGIRSRIPYLKELGVTAIWLTPWYDNPDEANQCDKPWCPNNNYHGYHAIDYYGVENHFGSMKDLQDLVDEARRNGIKVIQDQVANHVGIQHPWAKRPPLDNWFSKYEQNSFRNAVLLSPNSSQKDRDNLLKGWFNELLPDLNQDEPEVSRYLVQNALWWIGTTGIEGIRQDTIQYMSRTFIRDWSSAIRKQYPGYYLVGEVFEEDSAQTAFFQGGKTGWDGIDTQLPSVFDFKLWRTSLQVFAGKRPASSLRDVLKYDGLYANINNVTTLTNNHDTDRFMSLPGATVEGAMQHIGFMLSTRGIPQVYYGEELGMTGGHDPDNRKDLPSLETLNDSQRQMLSEYKAWIELRKRSNALKRGRITDITADDGMYVFARIYGDERMVVGVNTSNENSGAKFDASVIGIDAKRVVCRPEGGKASEKISNHGATDGVISLSLPPRSVLAYECSAAKN